MESLIIVHFYFLSFTLLIFGVSYPFTSFTLTEKIIRRTVQMNGFISLAFIISSFFLINNTKTFNLFYDQKLVVNNFNLSVYLVVTFLLAIISKFSFDYLHKEIGFHKFFINLILFWFGLFLFVFSSSNMMMFAGWEFIGISSIFLISYYSYRRAPIYSSLYVMGFYKFADILLITAILFLGHNDLLINHAKYSEWVYLLIVIAGLIKSSCFPFTSWLPKAMEGPTPSSAIFYVSLAINTGVILLFKFWDQISQFPIASNILLISAVLTVIYSSFQNRVQTDIKSVLAYSSSVQIGLVLIELYLGFEYLAYFHLLSNTMLKTYQFLRTPSLLHEHHLAEGEFGDAIIKSGIHLEDFLPKFVKKVLYQFSLNHFYIDSIYNLSVLINRYIAKYIKLFLHPLVENKEELTYKSLVWWIYYSIVVITITMSLVEVTSSFFDSIPIVIFLLSFPIIFEKKSSPFISMFFLYKMFESFIVYGVHAHVPMKWLGVLVTGIFSFALIKFCKIDFSIKDKKKWGSLVIFLMLFFTNFPFLLQSLTNEHIIDEFILNDQIVNLVLYCLANTFFNIGLYNFIFDRVYIREGIDG